MSRGLSEMSHGLRVVWIATALYALIMFLLGVDRYIIYRAGADLGLFTQSISAAFHGFSNQIDHVDHFRVHFSPVLYLCAPFLWLIRSPLALTALQAIACALTAPAIYLFARRRMDERIAVLAGVTTLLYPPLVGVTFTDFHENGFAPAAIAWLLWAVDARRWGWAALFAALALSVKEDEAVILTVLALAFVIISLRRGDRQGALFGGAVAVAASLTFVAFFTIVRPLAGATTYWIISDYYTNPQLWTGDLPHDPRVLVMGRLTFLLEALGPLLFLPVLSRWFWLAIPGFVEVLASAWPLTYTMGTHHAGVWVSYVLIAYADAVGALAKGSTDRALTLARMCPALCLLVLAFASPTHWGHFLGPRTAHDASLDRIIALVPSEASVGSFDEAYTHMSLNPNARIGMYVPPDYFVYDTNYDAATWRADIAPRVAAFVCAGLFSPVVTEDGVTLFKLVRPVSYEKFLRTIQSPPRCSPKDR